MYGSNVVEVQGRFKLEPIENANAEIIEKMGLSSELETMGGLEMNLYNQFNAWNFPFKGPLQAITTYAIMLAIKSTTDVAVNNMTKGLKWAYSPFFICIPPVYSMAVWLSYLKVGNPLILEACDEVNVSAGILYDYGLVKEIGVQIVYYDEPEEKGRLEH
ncbi:hypothetical protein Vadar_030013 [Vaccinium darrowii]|uniref:Uncharacterized protein n=1 Tax=Vaccinium darrowii TaxID=229202 RepID=A0ACB7ZMS3_9ERIC|nr:hypothetical protein Vadar_030013 [Vaccinium darrowii]